MCEGQPNNDAIGLNIQNIEKTIQGILKKFEVLDDYEKRKIVFWYDKDKTVEFEEELGEIRIAIAKNDKSIKLHVLNNNFFETKKLLEHDDKESNYLIYSPEAERGNQSLQGLILTYTSQ